MGKPILRGGLWKTNFEQLKKWLPNAYYYLFYGALGSLFPFLNIYYRSLGLNPWQIGILGGIRPLIALFSGPFWCFVSNRYKVRKIILLASLIGWVAFTLPIAFVNHGQSATCPSMGPEPSNETKSDENHPKSSKREFITSDIFSDFDEFLKNFKDKKHSGIAKAYSSKIDTNNDKNIDIQSSVPGNVDEGRVRRDIRSKRITRLSEKNPRFVDLGKPFLNSFSLSGLTFRKKPIGEIRKPYDFKSRGTHYANKRQNPYAKTIFIEIFFFVLLGQMFQTPTDDVNIQYDGTFLEPLGVMYQNVPAKNSLYSSLGIGIIALITGVLLNIAPKYEICGEEYSDYRISFFIFGILITSALLVSLTFSFKYRKKKTGFEVLRCLKELCVPQHFCFVGIVLLMGTFRGVLYNFLFWNIIEIDGTEIIIGVTVVSQYLSDSIMAMSAPILMKYIGYIGMIYLGLASYALRFVIYSWLSTPDSAWVVPSVELLQGISHSTAWSAFILYVINYTPRSTYPVGIFIVQGLYLGVGSSFGAMISGGMIEGLDANVTFRLFGLASIMSCLVFTMTQPTGKDEILPDEVEPMSHFTDEDDYSSLSEEELLFDYKSRQNVIYIPPKEGEEDEMAQRKKVILPSTNAPFVPTMMAFVHPQNEKEPVE